MSGRVLCEDVEPGLVRIVLNDAESRNAMTEEMGAEFYELVGTLHKRKDVRVVVLTGSGRAFSAGGHLDMLFQKTQIEVDKNRELMELFYRQFLSIAELPMPVIAAIQGHAVGAGLCLALACDIRVASTDAKFGLNFVHLGLHPGMGVTYFLPRIVGRARATELLFRGQTLTADEAYTYGILNHVVAPSAHSELVLSVAHDIMRAGPQAVRALKRTLLMSSESSLPDCLRREAACQALDYAGSEFLEGITAAREKRPAKF